MKVLYQWALKDPQDWQQIDAKDFATLPKKPIPIQLGGQNNQLGWLADLMVQGVRFNGYDHIAVEKVIIQNEEAVKVTCWNDDPQDYPIGQRQARVWTFLPLVPDAKLGGAINTRQSQIIYAEGERYVKLISNPPENTTIKLWFEFVPPPDSITRHGVWLTDQKWQEHLDTRIEWSWRHWVDHLLDSETEIETEYRHNSQLVMLPTPRRMLKVQRDMGRWKKAEGTITYYQRDTDRPTGVYTDDHEDALELTTATAVSESITVDNGVGNFVFTSPTNEPNSADWPSGTYRCQLDCTAASTGVGYGLLVTGRFARVDSALTSELQSTEQLEGQFTGTGLKLATKSWNPSAGADTDRFACRVRALGDSHGDAITLELNTADSYADGPWESINAAMLQPQYVLPPHYNQKKEMIPY